ncbi:MAG: Nif3-like dinuclear metal center hexameric protein [Clostridia bacterium]|nr:Nif3-like dinuclear metal center hexameric protein [Clostridia bacterium]
MKLNEVLTVLEKVAPVALSDEFCKKFGMYDNSGVIINCGADINGALFSLDLSENAVKKAKELGYNLIVTHHPAIYGGISRLDLTRDPQAIALAECIKNGISVISMHLNFDAAPQGIDFHLMQGLGGDNPEILAKLDNGGYGRVYPVKQTQFTAFVENVKNTFNSDRVIIYGKERSVKKVASFCGAGCDERAIAFAEKHGADVFVSSDLKHHEITAILGRGINVIHLTHYSAENYGFEKIYSRISKDLSVPSSYFSDAELT